MVLPAKSSKSEHFGPLEDGPEQHMALFTAIPADVFGASGLENSFFFNG